MKRTIISQLFLVALVLLAVGLCSAQSPSVRPTSEQSLQELVDEVRQLRAALQRMNAAVYKGQVMIERYKLQQESVVRLENELYDVREQLSDLRLQLPKMREMSQRADSEVEVGMKHPVEQTSLKTELVRAMQREQRLSMRESQLASELELERQKLNELNRKLNVLESEMAAK